MPPGDRRGDVYFIDVHYKHVYIIMVINRFYKLYYHVSAFYLVTIGTIHNIVKIIRLFTKCMILQQNAWTTKASGFIHGVTSTTTAVKSYYEPATSRSLLFIKKWVYLDIRSTTRNIRYTRSSSSLCLCHGKICHRMTGTAILTSIYT